MAFHFNTLPEYCELPLSFSTGIERAVGVFEHSECKRDMYDKFCFIMYMYMTER